MSQTQFPPPQTPGQTPGDEDPLAKLHKMSTTAGLGSGDYVAVNGTAVFSLLLGLGGLLALVAEPLLLLPIAGIVTGIIAWRQIAGSNGTQTGKGLVIVALLFSVAIAGFVGVRKATEGMRTRKDRQAISELMQDLAKKIGEGDTKAAYQLFSDRFAGRTSQQAFDERIKLITDYYGKLTKNSWNGLAEFTTDPATGGRYAFATIELSYEKAPQPIKDTLAMRRIGDKWVIDDMPNLFPPPRQPGQQPGQ